MVPQVIITPNEEPLCTVPENSDGSSRQTLPVEIEESSIQRTQSGITESAAKDSEGNLSSLLPPPTSPYLFAGDLAELSLPLPPPPSPFPFDGDLAELSLPLPPPPSPFLLDGKFGPAGSPPPPTTPTDYAEYVEAVEDPECAEYVEADEDAECVEEDEDSKEDENDEFAEEDDDDEFADDAEDSEPTAEDWETFRAFKRLEKQKNLSTSGRRRLSSRHRPSSSCCRRSSGRHLSSRHRPSSSRHRRSSSRRRRSSGRRRRSSGRQQRNPFSTASNTTFLVDNADYRKFGRWKENKDCSVLWRCNHRPQKNPCKCYVKQKGNTFALIGQHSDSCHPIPGLDLQLTLLRDAKQAALNSKELPAKAIVEPLLYKSNKKCLLPKIENWCRVVNRFREDERPPNPLKIDFELVKKVLPKEFQVHDINSKKLGRALVFFTEHQMEL
ncbi:hypothetical protein DAPPUDRAFT_256498 [Daphnia pulex]|uniref:FLYWCH-type domain-containing protein n=1 Tax=Daphnia pulex TaxID=6669 RepID=E9HBH8_DAPPU|nr:hypothetical protein DAPPUDRAFT_256498 [Daphnia pulex]|eukprot:EFX70915.1 hypothetical protein DAPPUDRAFT_256498 [Daphnia pulex]